MNFLHWLLKSNLLPDEMLRLILTRVKSKSKSWRSFMQSRKNIYNYTEIVSAIAVSAALGLSAGPGFAGTASQGAHAALPAAQSDKNPHAWGLAPVDIAVAPAAQSDKNPHAWGLTPVDVAVQALTKLKP
jgi:hypothetical protein